MLRLPVHPSKAHEVKERRLKVSELYKKRYRQFEIARILNCDQSTISRDIKAIHKEWSAQCVDNIHIVRIRELADLDEMEKECIIRLEELKKHPHQGSRWMEERRKIKERRARMLGLDTEQRYVVRKEITIVDKAKRDEVMLAALGNRLPPGMTLEDVQKKLPLPASPDGPDDEENIPDADYENNYE